MDALKEIARVLKPAGSLGMVWNIDVRLSLIMKPVDGHAASLISERSQQYLR